MDNTLLVIQATGGGLLLCTPCLLVHAPVLMPLWFYGGPGQFLTAMGTRTEGDDKVSSCVALHERALWISLTPVQLLLSH